VQIPVTSARRESRVTSAVGVSAVAFRGAATPRVNGGRGRLEVVPASADGVSRPSHDHQHQADHQENEADSPKQGELEQKSYDQKDDSKNDHRVHLVSMWM
jgi:hypothetical protein